MQINSANLLVAAQQALRQAAPQKPAGFAPLDFKQTAPAAQAPAQGPRPRIGATLDIRV